MDKQPQPRQYLINSEQLKDIMKYLMTRPYAEVVTIMNSLATLTPVKTLRKAPKAYVRPPRLATKATFEAVNIPESNTEVAEPVKLPVILTLEAVISDTSILFGLISVT